MLKQQELTLAQQIANLAIWEWRANTDELTWNPGSVPLFGRPLEQLKTGDEFFECVLPEDRVIVRAALRDALAGGPEYYVKFGCCWPDGQIRWIAANGRVVNDAQRGKMVIGVARDITEFQVREAKLREQAKLLEMTHEPILVRDGDDRITFWNSGSQRVYEYSAQEALGRVSHELLQTRFPQSLATCRHALDRAGFWEGELVHRTKAGRLVHVGSRWQKFTDGKVSILETNFDLTHYRALQVAQIWENKARLLGELAHEINNPLEAASGALHMLKTQPHEPMGMYAEILESSIRRIAEFVRKSKELHDSDRSGPPPASGRNQARPSG